MGWDAGRRRVGQAKPRQNNGLGALSRCLTPLGVWDAGQASGRLNAFASTQADKVKKGFPLRLEL